MAQPTQDRSLEMPISSRVDFLPLLKKWSMVAIQVDPTSDSKTVVSCIRHAYKFNYLACKHMFLLTRWDPTYIVNGDHQPQRFTIDLDLPLPLPLSLTLLPDPMHPNNPQPSLIPQDPSTFIATNNTGDNTSISNPQETVKSLIDTIKCTFDQSSFDDDKLFDIVKKLQGLHSELQQARILPPNARLPMQHTTKGT
ncbi:hypothetical protein K492DRAFT_208016 [Lichtheimia hyalospora FSU 10163]|nr:hypothetical protein K492DRAFT_208016 [Lichtheimia hyalospora FSU 10163]